MHGHNLEGQKMVLRDWVQRMVGTLDLISYKFSWQLNTIGSNGCLVRIWGVYKLAWTLADVKINDNNRNSEHKSISLSSNECESEATNGFDRNIHNLPGGDWFHGAICYSLGSWDQRQNPWRNSVFL